MLDAEDVGVDAVRKHDGALLEHVLERVDAVAQLRRLLVVHARREARFISRTILVITLRSWLAMNATNCSTIARCSSIVTFCEHGPPQRPIWPGKHDRPLCHRPLVARVGAGAHRERLDHQLDGLAHGPDLRVRTEVAGTGDAVVARDHHPRRLVGHGDRHERVALVVAELDVVRRDELLDPGVLELERLEVAGDRRPLDARRRSAPCAGCARAGCAAAGSSCRAASAG